MRASVALVLGLCIGMTAMWLWSSNNHVTLRPVSSAWAQANPKSPADKPWTAAELEEIARFYETTADTVEDEALQYERTAAAITPLADTKGFRRSALTIAAQAKWKQASELRLLAAEHREKAKRMYAKERGE